MEIEINGVKYQQKEQPKRKPMSKALITMMLMGEMAGGFGIGGGSRQKETPNVDIIKEYGLIQQKKSGLSKSQRDWVVWQFEKNFEPIKIV